MGSLSNKVVSIWNMDNMVGTTTVFWNMGQWELDKKGITLTKVDNNKTEIDILIRGDYYGQLLTGKIEQLAGGLTAIQTVLGWTLIGNTPSERPETSAQMVITLLTTQQRVTSLWELEIIGIRGPTEVISEKEKNVLMQEKFREKICRGHDGRYLVSLPWKEGIGTIPNNLEAMTQKLTQKGQFVPYDEVFRSWFRENLIEEVDEEVIKPIGHVLPHRPIYKVQSETTPIRPVYDASCKASKRSLSLNECLETGPNLIELSPEILIRFREKKIGAIADIRKAFQTIGIDEKETDYLRFLWWDEQDPSKIRTLRHTRVVFGLTSSPFILAAVLKYHLESIVDYRETVADVLKRSFYVDNLVFSVDEPDELECIKEVANDIMDEAKMTLREWEYGALSWISTKHEWSIFVSNRVNEIRSSTNIDDWRFVPGTLNPADLPSRGCYAPQFILSKWWEGSQWLRESEDKWPKQKPIPNEEQVLEEEKGTVVQNTIVQNRKFWYISKFSSYKANLRVLAWVLRFIKILKKEEIQGKTSSTHEVVQTEKLLIRLIQRDSLGKGQISHLKTKVQSDGLMYIETKLLYDQSPEEFRKPVLFPCDHPITEKLIRETHSNNCHAGVHFLLSKLREKFCILKARKTIKRVVRGSIICRRHAEKANTIPCAPLPKDRLFMGRSFEVTGVDLMGPLYLKNGQKIWITLLWKRSEKTYEIGGVHQ
ncbi:hypothetical protein LAZ67_21000068 [Cordylochernes scorpioides]|uniref:Integrase zinc-binding domain-containing protein n=1 Tax=Cordylochernes scorpioides TaxID=51811 RepID=A0ABY6LL06_9ARAC|nr:hypothetical protein LAZ67_21000068 [Cordylochernes scorpioides]